MPSLLEEQNRFATALLEGASSAGMAVYRGNVYGNWHDALAGAYPIVRKIVGREFFTGLAYDYARAISCTSGDLNEYGGPLARFLDTWPPALDLPYLPDVARMEWLAHRAHYAADACAFDFAKARQSGLRPKLAAACALLASAWPLARIWLVHQDDYEGEIAVDLDAGPDRILVHRPRWRVQVLSLAPGDYAFLLSASAGATLEEALAGAIGADPLFSPWTALARWVDAGVIVQLHTS